ncbi:MAG: methyl-accepting chemotaxis protein [Candidatus Cohnella colombiensis]|uniref:Methyl-accepting chemotaxis protein n=1 Tax=Candidatus Cohnella colombiensis TaxID=3121368 RepID=A0AA95EZI0_9BACL|nr:MAG: methyl-accepting chemotaxis protein [Cohnella sp.]
MKVSTRLWLGFGVLCLFIGGLGSFALITMSSVNSNTEQIIHNWMPAVSKAYQIKLEAGQIHELQRQLIDDPTDQSLEQIIREKKDAVKALVEAYVSQSISEEGTAIASRFFIDYEGGEATDEQIKEQAKSGNIRGAKLLYEGVAARLFNDINKSLEQLIAISETEATAAGATNKAEFESGFQIIIIALCFVLLLAIGLSLWTIRSILLPIRTINGVLQSLAGAKGDLSQRLRIASGDEIETMANNVNEVLATVENMVNHIRDATTEVAASSERIETNCSQLSDATVEIADAITGLSAQAQEQAETTHASQRLVREYLNKLNHLAEKAQETFELANDAKQKTEHGSQQMASVLDVMMAITAQNAAANESLSSFRTKLVHIGNVNEMIKSISEQTNILSLNAGIESTRAGIHGKGFAVIANEVRKLSNDTKGSAQSIIQLMSSIQEDVEALTQQFQSNTRNIDVGCEQIQQLTATFQTIQAVNGTVMDNGMLTKNEATSMLNSSATIVDRFDQLSTLSEDQSAVSQQVSASVEEQLSSTQMIESFTKELSEQSGKLKGLVEQFHVANVNA